jgi:hypothetical protein
MSKYETPVMPPFLPSVSSTKPVGYTEFPNAIPVNRMRVGAKHVTKDGVSGTGSCVNVMPDTPLYNPTEFYKANPSAQYCLGTIVNPNNGLVLVKRNAMLSECVEECDKMGDSCKLFTISDNVNDAYLYNYRMTLDSQKLTCNLYDTGTTSFDGTGGPLSSSMVTKGVEPNTVSFTNTYIKNSMSSIPMIDRIYILYSNGIISSTMDRSGIFRNICYTPAKYIAVTEKEDVLYGIVPDPTNASAGIVSVSNDFGSTWKPLFPPPAAYSNYRTNIVPTSIYASYELVYSRSNPRFLMTREWSGGIFLINTLSWVIPMGGGYRGYTFNQMNGDLYNAYEDGWIKHIYQVSADGWGVNQPTGQDPNIIPKRVYCVSSFKKDATFENYDTNACRIYMSYVYRSQPENSTLYFGYYNMNLNENKFFGSSENTIFNIPLPKNVIYNSGSSAGISKIMVDGRNRFIDGTDIIYILFDDGNLYRGINYLGNKTVDPWVLITGGLRDFSICPEYVPAPPAPGCSIF